MCVLGRFLCVSSEFLSSVLHNCFFFFFLLPLCFLSRSYLLFFCFVFLLTVKLILVTCVISWANFVLLRESVFAGDAFYCPFELVYWIPACKAWFFSFFTHHWKIISVSVTSASLFWRGCTFCPFLPALCGLFSLCVFVCAFLFKIDFCSDFLFRPAHCLLQVDSFVVVVFLLAG